MFINRILLSIMRDIVIIAGVSRFGLFLSMVRSPFDILGQNEMHVSEDLNAVLGSIGLLNPATGRPI